MPAQAVPGRGRGAVGGREVDVEVRGMQVNPAVEITTGRALGLAGASPICIVYRVGMGQAILLNFPRLGYALLEA